MHGIRYRSAQHEDGVCVALFVPHERCVEEPGDDVLGLLVEDTKHGAA